MLSVVSEIQSDDNPNGRGSSPFALYAPMRTHYGAYDLNECWKRAKEAKGLEDRGLFDVVRLFDGFVSQRFWFDPHRCITLSVCGRTNPRNPWHTQDNTSVVWPKRNNNYAHSTYIHAKLNKKKLNNTKKKLEIRESAHIWLRHSLVDFFFVVV